MNPPINFLPWRQQRRTAFLRFWLLMFVAPLLLAVGITLILRLTSNAEARVDTVLLQAEQQLARSLQITKPRLLERQQLREQRLQRQRQRQFTRDWQSALEALAALLPEHAWLTTISWQQGTLEIKGLTTSITALNALETSLRQDASFHLNQRGATQQDAQGRWQFEYQLTRKVSDGHALWLVVRHITPPPPALLGILVADVSYAHFSVIDTPGRVRCINSTTGESSPAVGRTISPGRHHSLQRGKNAALFATGFSVIRRATGFLASIRAGR
ncbi:putative membrane protein [Escherichia coli TA280]|nr:putative membrane protein [Escherichia coli TA280]